MLVIVETGVNKLEMIAEAIETNDVLNGVTVEIRNGSADRIKYDSPLM